MDEEIRQALTEVQEMKKMCGNINMKLTNIVTQRGQDCKKKLEAEYQRGFEDGKADNDKRCVGCKWEGNGKDHSPCDYCCNCYSNQWTAKQTDDKIEVGDIVERYLDGKLDSTGLYLGDADEKGDYWNCLFWTGACFVTLGYPKNQLKKTDKHYDIYSILKEMQL